MHTHTHTLVQGGLWCCQYMGHKLLPPSLPPTQKYHDQSAALKQKYEQEKQALFDNLGPDKQKYRDDLAQFRRERHNYLVKFRQRRLGILKVSIKCLS